MDLRFTVKGVVKKVWPTETLQSGFRKRKVILTDDLGENSKWPRLWCFILKQERVELADCVRDGARVEIEFVIDGREWEGTRGIQYFTDLVALKINVLSQAADPTPEKPTEQAGSNAPTENDDIPF